MSQTRTSDFVRNTGDMLSAIRACLANNQLLPALVLLYSFIDCLAWASSDKSKNSNRKNYESWVESWFLPHLHTKAPEITAIDLYAARCGVVHSLTPESDLSLQGKARKIAYAWGTAKAEILRDALQKTSHANQVVAVHCDDLVAAVSQALEALVQAAEADPALALRLHEAAGQHYAHIPAPIGSAQNGA